MYFSRHFRKRAGAITPFVLAAFALAAPLTVASTVTLAWDPNPEPDIAGYKVYLGNSPQNYSSVVDAGNNTSQILSNLIPGTTYHFAATAYNTSGLESAFSSELSHTVVLDPNTAPLISAIADANMPANTSLTISFTVDDAETSADSLILTATSSNPALMPESNIVLEGNGATRTVTLTPEEDQSGTATITIIVSDGSLSASESFALHVSVPPAALVAAYSFDAFSGTILEDLAGNTNTGVINGAVWATTGRFGGALAFDGINDVVTVADAANLDLTSGMTIEAWVYPTAQNAGGWRSVLVKESEGGGVYNLHASTDTSVPAVSMVRRSGTFNEVRGTNPVPANTWTHLAATYDAKTLRLFVNGIEVSSEPLRGPLLASAGPLRIGGNSIRGEYFQGMIDEVRIYNRALSPPEIEADMHTPLGPARSVIGNIADGSLTDLMGASWINAGRYQATTNLSVNTVFAKVAAINGRYKCAIYTDSGSQPGQLVQSSLEIAGPTTGWQSFPLSSTVALTNGQYYWLAIWSDHPDSKVYYSGTDGTLRWGNYNYGPWPDLLATGAGANVNYCIYATDALLENTSISDVPASTEVPFVMDVITLGDSSLSQLTWESIPGAVYRVLARTNPLDPKWVNISADLLAEGSLTFWVNPDTTALANMYPCRVIRVE